MRSRLPSRLVAAAVEMVQAEGAGLVLGYFLLLACSPFHEETEFIRQPVEEACQRAGQSRDL